MKIGCDIEEIKRFKEKKEDLKFLNRIFTENEIQYCFSKVKPEENLCVRFCAKEAVVKALSDKTISYKNIEILNDENGKPCVKVNGIDENIEISLSHSKEYAMAVALIS
ncbi:MAG: holo-[acyl-carrier-protein] synthase [Cyanobacteria bacterium SIG30]|nr:holo-[acyl-carrier-protein] synthase [Cyanobacteria bacterium SIG30]